jgi:hypothetical protein
LKLFQELEERVIKENDGGFNSSMIYFLYCKDLCGCHNVPPFSTTMKKKKRKESKEVRKQ